MAKLYKGNIDFGLVLNQTGAQPLDSRSVVQSYADLLNSETFGSAIYNGMTVATVDDQKVYMLVDKTKVTSKDGWKEVGSGNGSLALSAFTITAENKIFEATAENIGQIIYVTGGTESYPAGPYIVIAAGEVSKLGTTTATGNIPGDIAALQNRVGNVELNKADLTGLTALTKTVNDNYTTYDTHAKDAFIHITQDERTIWNQAHTWSSGNTIEISTLKNVVNTKADASALTNYLLAENAYDDTEVRGLITAEATARTEAFNTLSGAVDTKVSVNIFNTLTGTVESNYNTLNGLITAETEARVNAITSLTETVNTKASINDLTAHTSSNDIHVTTDDKNKWNKVVEDFNTFITGDTEAALNTLVDLQQWISEHGTEAQAMATAITANLESITSLTQTVDTISGKVDNNTSAITKNAQDIATKAAQSDLDALAGIVGKENDNSGIFAKLSKLTGDVENKLTKLATVNGKSFSEDGVLVIDSADINLNEGFGKKLVNEEEIDRYTTGNTIQYVLKDIDTRIDAINTTIDNVTGGGVIADIMEGDGISVDKSSKTTPTVSVNTDDSSVTIDSNKKISVKLSTSENNALYVNGNGLFVQAITIDGNDTETESNN